MKLEFTDGHPRKKFGAIIVGRTFIFPTDRVLRMKTGQTEYMQVDKADGPYTLRGDTMVIPVTVDTALVSAFH